jgi:hypothetical protein
MKPTTYFQLAAGLRMDGVHIHYPIYINDTRGKSSTYFFDCGLYNDAVRSCRSYNLQLVSQYKEI